MNILLDSDVVLEVLRAKDRAVLVKWSVLTESKDEVFFSPLTAAEIWPRVRPDEHAAIARFFRPLTCAKIDYSVSLLAAELFREYSKSHAIEITDALIVSTGMPKIKGKAGRHPKLSADAVGQALSRAGGNKAKAARLLGVGRATLYNFLNEHPELGDPA